MEEMGQKSCWSYRFFLICIFTGSIFLTSGKFVNEINSPKSYFAAACLSIALFCFTISQKPLVCRKNGIPADFQCIHIICFLQACYGLIQFMGWLPSNHSRFVITGSFDNPAGFAAILAMEYPIGLFMLKNGKKSWWYFSIINAITVAIAVFLSGSRTGIIAIGISSLLFIVTESNRKVWHHRCFKMLIVLIMLFFIAGAFTLYHQKKDSVLGRCLIWKVSFEMIKEKPVFGHGYKAFKAEYMDYQAEYFKNHPDSRFSQLADNVQHPFNEFIKVAVEFGCTGLSFIILFIGFIFRRVVHTGSEYRGLVLSGLVAFIVFSCFSYPLKYFAVCLILIVYLKTVFPSIGLRIKNRPLETIARSMVFIICIYSLLHIYRLVKVEVEWKRAAVNSLHGNFNEMLPEYKRLYASMLRRNPLFLYNYGAELNVFGENHQSIEILSECSNLFNDYDLQMILADNYYQTGQIRKAIQAYKHASNMIPCRFLPLFQLFEIHKEAGELDEAIRYANEIVHKPVKIHSGTVLMIRNEAKAFLDEVLKNEDHSL